MEYRAEQQRLARLQIEVRPGARAIAKRGYDPVYGGRPPCRYIQREVETRIGRALVADDVRDESTITLDVEADELVVRVESRGADSASTRQVERWRGRGLRSSDGQCCRTDR
jgi:ATP-dependent Clp protease ATP-binding subunit ClpA